MPIAEITIRILEGLIEQSRVCANDARNWAESYYTPSSKYRQHAWLMRHANAHEDAATALSFFLEERRTKLPDPSAAAPTSPEPVAWPERLTLRDTHVYADEGQRIFTTATGYGYAKQEYVRADLAAAPAPPVSAAWHYDYLRHEIERHGGIIDPEDGSVTWSPEPTTLGNIASLASAYRHFSSWANRGNETMIARRI